METGNNTISSYRTLSVVIRPRYVDIRSQLKAFFLAGFTINSSGSGMRNDSIWATDIVILYRQKLATSGETGIAACRQVASPQRRFISRTYVGPHKRKENCLKPRRDGMGMGSSRYDVLEKGDEGSRSSSTLRTNSIVFADRVGGGVQKMKIIARDVYGWTL